MCVKTDEIQVGSTPEFIVLFQHQFPGFDNILWLYKVLSLGLAGRSVYGNCTIFATSCASIQSFKNYVKKPATMQQKNGHPISLI